MRIQVLQNSERETRSPNCPNDITREEERVKELAAASGAGKCGSCAWGFFSHDHHGHQLGEDASLLNLVPLKTLSGQAAGYKSQCGQVTLYRDPTGRVGALRTVEGKERFFPGIHGNWAFERFLRTTPLV